MRPLIEMLEDERKLMQQLESISRYLFKDDDPEVRDLLLAQRAEIKKELTKIQAEIGDKLEKLLG